MLAGSFTNQLLQTRCFRVQLFLRQGRERSAYFEEWSFRVLTWVYDGIILNNSHFVLTLGSDMYVPVFYDFLFTFLPPVRRLNSLIQMIIAIQQLVLNPHLIQMLVMNIKKNNAVQISGFWLIFFPPNLTTAKPQIYLNRLEFSLKSYL